MSTVQEYSRSDLPPPDDPFRYGWRFVQRQLPDGTKVDEQIPLTLEDVLHPEEDDVVPENEIHSYLRAMLFLILHCRYRHDPSTLVLSDTLIYWHHPEFEKHSPDISVTFGVRDRKPSYSSFDVTEEGIRPQVLLEISSPHTRINDVDKKLREYHLVDVPCYVIIDRKNDDDDWKLLGYHHAPGAYQPISPDANGRIYLEPLQLYLGTDGQRIYLFDPKTGTELENHEELVESLEQQKAVTEQIAARADAEAKARLEAETRLRELEAELARLKNQ